MYTKKHKPNYVDFSGIVSNTIPGRCYSIAELLSRVVRGERLPGIDQSYNEVDRSPVVDWSDPKQRKDEFAKIDKEFDSSAQNPLFERDSDIIEAKSYVEEIDAKIG